MSLENRSHSNYGEQGFTGPGNGWAEGYQHIDQTPEGLAKDKEFGRRWLAGIAGALTSYSLGHLGVDSRTPIRAAAFAATVRITEDPINRNTPRSRLARGLNSVNGYFPYFLAGAGIGAMGIGLEATTAPAIVSDQTDKPDNLVRVTNPAQTDQGQLQCEPIMANGLGATNGIPPELQGRTTCFNVNGQQESVIFYCDQVLKPDSPLAALDGNSTNQNPLCLEGSLDINGNGVSDYNPIKLNVGAINGLTAPIEAVQKSPAPPSPTPTPEPSVGEAVAAVGGIVLLLLFGGFLNAKRSYASGHLDGEKKGISIGGEIEEAVKSNPAVKKLSNKVRKAERKKRGIK